MKVLAIASACLVVTSVASADTVLLDFSASRCAPCREMEPIVAGLEREGYRIERVNIDSEPGKLKMRQFGVKNIPTFIALSDGRETGRVVGAVPADNLKRLAGPPEPARSSKPKVSSVPDAPAETPLAALPTSGQPTGRELIERSVRIVVEESKSRSFGTGTVLRSVPGETLVLTCGHLFDGISPRAKTTIEFFGAPAGEKTGAKFSGELVARDRDADLSLVRVTTEQVFPTARVAARGFVPAPGAPTQSVGCDHGQSPTLRKMKITAVNRYVGAPTIECNNEPVEGRSGGGLFSESGELIGVCSAREPSEHRGIYGGLAAVHAILDRQGLAGLYSKPGAAGDWRLASNGAKRAAPAGQDRITLPPPDEIGLNVGPAAPSGAEHAEVVCVIRSLNDPKAPAKIIVLNRASADFLAQLEKEQAEQASRSNTSMRLSNSTNRRASATDLDRRDPRGPVGAMPLNPEDDSRPPIQESAKWKKDWLPGTDASSSAGRR